MAHRFEAALGLALEDLRARGDVDGILFFGSALSGTTGPTSDLDLYVLLKGKGTKSQISLRRCGGVATELLLATAASWRQRIESGDPVVVTAFATGQPLADESGRLAELMAAARGRHQAGPPALPAEAVERWRFRLTDLADDLEDVAGQPADERRLGALLVSLALEAYCELNRLWGEQPKRRLAYVERYDSELGRMARSFFTGDLDRHLARAIAERVLEPFGGRIDSLELPGE